MDEIKKVSANRVKKEEIVGMLNEKLGKSKAIVFTNYQGLTHKQLEGLKRAIKPMQAEYVVAKNSLVLRALDANKIKVEDAKQFEGPTGTLLIYDDVVGPLKALAKLIKELGIPNVKFGIIDNENVTEEQVLKISTLPSKEVLLTQIVLGLKSPIFGLHRALNWNLQKLVMTLNAVAQSKPASAADAPVAEPAPAAEIVSEAPVETPTQATEAITGSNPSTEPETILAETKEELNAEETVSEQAAEATQAQAEEVKAETTVEEVKTEIQEEPTESEGGEN